MPMKWKPELLERQQKRKDFTKNMEGAEALARDYHNGTNITAVYTGLNLGRNSVTRFDINDRMKIHMSQEVTGVAGRHYSIGMAVSKNHKIKWMLDAVEYIMNKYNDPVFKYDYYFDFRKYFVPLLDATFDYVNGVGYVRKNADDLSLEDIKKKIETLGRIWDALDHFRDNPEPRFENVRCVQRLIQLLKLMAGYDFDDKQKWIFYQHDDTFHIDICDVGDMNPNQTHYDMDNPEDDNDIEFMNPDKANKNPLRRRIVLDVDNPEGIPGIHGNPETIQNLLYQLEHYV